MFHENIAEYGLTVSAKPAVSRVTYTLEDGRTISALKWGTAA
ncbi:MAG: alpha/beta hydrolase, partial [Actinobacteria bacterium]|nr:alpha/beta hydrolase [Actinomycetota bacterium]